jgi:hypothetical protein
MSAGALQNYHHRQAFAQHPNSLTVFPRGCGYHPTTRATSSGYSRARAEFESGFWKYPSISNTRVD